MKGTVNKNSNNVLIISQAFHHLEKSIFLKKKIFKEAKILNIYPIISKLRSIKELLGDGDIEHYQSFDDLNFDSFKTVEIFIFFSFSPTLPQIEFVKKIRESKKKIVLIQDNHQFSIHNGVYNSAILEPDLIIAASEAERKFFIEKLHFNKEIVLSYGWLFQNINQGLKDKKEAAQKILIVFSAPFNITLNSDETYIIRKKIIDWVVKNFPDYKLLIKIHPHENPKIFQNFMNRLKINFELLSSQSSINEAISLSDIIVCSILSQSPLDAITQDIDKRLILYYLSKTNFLLEQNLLTYEDECSHDQFGIFETSILQRKAIKERHLNLEQGAFEKILGRVSNILVDKKTNNTELGAMLWLFIYKKPSYVIDFLKNHKSQKYKNLSNLIFNKEFDLKKLSQDFYNPREKDPLSIIIIRYYLNKKYVSAANIDMISKNFFSVHVFTFFFRDFIRFTNLLNAKALAHCLDPVYLELSQKIENFYVFKLKFFSLFFYVQKKVYAARIRFISMLFFYISDKILRIK